MAWAAMAKKAAEEPAKPVTEPRERVVAPVVHADAEDDAAQADDRLVPMSLLESTNALGRTANTFTLPTPTKGAMVLDTNAFIKETGLERYTALADVFVTTPQVLQECRDVKTRDSLERLPVGLIVLDPSPEAVKEVAAMSEKTGDFGALSRTDLRVCALALECARQLNALKPAIVPRGAVVNPTSNEHGITVVTEEQDMSGEDGDDDGDAAETTTAPATADAEASSLPPIGEDPELDARRRAAAAAAWGGGGGDDAAADGEKSGESGSDAGEGSDGDGEWITPGNIAKFRAEDAGETTAFGGGFACATSDFPMQNVLLHMGVPIVGPRGMLVGELRQWLLRCHACYTLVHDTTRQFCPECGSGDTLRRVHYIVDEKGQKKLFINFKRHLSTRGTKFALPKPRGGKRGTNKTLALREDQLTRCGAVSGAMKAERAAAAEDALAGFGEVKRQKRHDPDKPREASSYRRGNVNEMKKARAGRRK